VTGIDAETETENAVDAMFRGLMVDCCIVGGGPCGMMTGLLLARAGIEVVVLERENDFCRDFRGDTIYPSTLEVMSELGMLDALLKRPHREVKEFTGDICGRHVRLADFSGLRPEAPFIALVPQRDFLEFIAQEGRKLPGFRLMMGSEAVSLRFSGNRVIGVQAMAPDGPLEVRARSVVAADGRNSRFRAQLRLPVRQYGSAMDIFSFRVPRQSGDRPQSFGHVGRGRALVMLDRGDFWQCSFAIEKDAVAQRSDAALGTLREKLEDILPLPKERLEELDSWDKINVLRVEVNRLRQWARPGIICIGDSAHALSPIGGMDFNLAIQDAVATARVLNPLLRAGRTPSLRHLRRVERRRSLACHLTIRLQLLIQTQFLSGRFHGDSKSIPIYVALLNRSRHLRRLLARFIGFGFLPEHVPPSAAH